MLVARQVELEVVKALPSLTDLQVTNHQFAPHTTTSFLAMDVRMSLTLSVSVAMSTSAQNVSPLLATKSSSRPDSAQ